MITQQAVQNRLDEFVRLLSEGKLQEAAERPSEDMTFIGSGGSYIHGRADLLVAYRRMMALYSESVLKLELLEFRALSETAAAVISRWTFEMPDKTETGLSLTVFQEIGGRVYSVLGASVKER